MTRRLTYEFVKSEFERLGYVLITKEYKNARTPLEYICANGHLSVINMDGIKQGKGCAQCLGGIKLKYEYVKNQFEISDWILVSNEYKNSSTHLDVICPNGHLFSMSWDNFKQSDRKCHCIPRKRENLISEILAELGMPHNRQQTFDDCRNKNPLRFDFGVKLSMNDWVLIEYNGIQHYKPVKYFGGNEKFEYLQMCYKIKKDFCKKVNYKFIEIDGRLSDNEIKEILYGEFGGYFELN